MNVRAFSGRSTCWFTYVVVGVGLICYTLTSHARPAHADMQVAVQGVVGEQIGAGRISVVLESDAELLAAATGALKVSDQEGRIFFPVIAGDGPVRLLRRLAGGTDTWNSERIEIFFLFTGQTPFDVQITAADVHSKRLVPAKGPRLHRNMMNRWWREYRHTMQGQADDGDYPAIAEMYLTHMLAHRFDLPLPVKPLVFRRPDPGKEMWDLLTGAESLEEATIAEVIAGAAKEPKADQPIPPPVAWKSTESILSPAVEVVPAVEPLAEQIPSDCFYIRFGRFSNFLWFSELTEEAGGDIGRMVTLRGVTTDASARMQRQLAIDDLPFAQLLGDQVIADIAVIGRDMLIQQGAAIGVVLQESAPVIGPGINQLRAATATREAHRGCRLESVPVGDISVSLLTTPDNSIRSFYATRGPFHCIANCESIIESFLAIPQTDQSLANDADFLDLRRTLTAGETPTVFAFFPRKFFAGMTSPEYQIELSRRMRSSVEIRMLQIARYLYRHENRGNQDAATSLSGDATPSLEQLVESNLLPKNFGQRVDGSRLEETDGVIVDSLRGGLGNFMPIPDTPVAGATPAELKVCNTVSRFCAGGWDDWDPLAVVVRRKLNPKMPARERVTFEARISPFNRPKYERWISVLGEPSRERTTPSPDNLLTIEAVVDGGRYMPGVPEHHAMLCLRDLPDLPAIDPGRLFGKLQMAQYAPAYLACWPNVGLLRLIPTISLAPNLGPGYARLPFGLYRREADDFVAVSFHPELLALPKPTVEQDDRPYQIHVTLRDPSATGLTPWINAVTADRSLRASLGNVRFLHSLEQQLGVSSDRSRQLAESLAGGRLTCALGGEYEYGDSGNKIASWRSTAWSTTWPLQLADARTYRAPVVQYLRGLTLQAALLDTHAEVTGEIEFERSTALRAKEPAPLFQLFGSGRESAKTPKGPDRDAKPKDSKTNQRP